jgi:hypothetical protein
LTRFLAFRSAESVLGGGTPLSPREIPDPPHLVALFGEVREKRNTIWSEPRDLGEEDFDKLSELLQARDGKCLIGVVQGFVRQVPSQLSADTWRQLIHRADGEPDETNLADPLAAAESTPAAK